MRFTVFAFGGNNGGFQSALLSGLNAGSIGAIRYHNCNAGIADAAGVNAVRNCEEVRAASGEEDAQVFHATTLFTMFGVW